MKTDSPNLYIKDAQNLDPKIKTNWFEMFDYRSNTKSMRHLYGSIILILVSRHKSALFLRMNSNSLGYYRLQLKSELQTLRTGICLKL